MTALLTVEQALARLPVSRRTLSTLIKERSIGHLRLGRRIFFSEQDLEAFIASRHVEPTRGAIGCSHGEDGKK